MGEPLLTHPRLAQVTKLSIFMAPLSREEIIFLQGSGAKCFSPRALITDVMRRKLLDAVVGRNRSYRLQNSKTIEKRAADDYGELTRRPTASTTPYRIPRW